MTKYIVIVDGEITQCVDFAVAMDMYRCFCELYGKEHCHIYMEVVCHGEKV